MLLARILWHPDDAMNIIVLAQDQTHLHQTRGKS